ncbi:hypothetical protein L218DRAFT_623137 [Marasmius fiardii PR-910]|nr:hypothetical protein L218DRAFT_623137 [Marasmius fiardii PR-910]
MAVWCTRCCAIVCYIVIARFCSLLDFDFLYCTRLLLIICSCCVFRYLLSIRSGTCLSVVLVFVLRSLLFCSCRRLLFYGFFLFVLPRSTLHFLSSVDRDKGV